MLALPDRPPALYVIVDAAALGPDRVVAAACEMAALGVRWIQVRAKRLDDRDLFEVTRGVANALAETTARVWIDDRADIATLLPVAGVHVGQSDLPPLAVRAVLRSDQWIGCSTHDREQVAQAARDPCVDVIAVGPVFRTSSKTDPDPVVGLDMLRWARGQTDKPIVAIGGIDAGNLADVLAAGADSVAVLGAACRGDVRENVLRLVAAVATARPLTPVPSVDGP